MEIIPISLSEALCAEFVHADGIGADLLAIRPISLPLRLRAPARHQPAGCRAPARAAPRGRQNCITAHRSIQGAIGSMENGPDLAPGGPKTITSGPSRSGSSPGLYRYGVVSVEAARVWIHAGPWQSQVRYLETARHIREVLGVEIRLSRGITRMKPGDEALVVRRNYRPQDPRMKRTQPQWGAEDWEFALLLRVQ